MMRRTPRFVPGDGVNHDSKGFSNVEEELRGGFRSVTHIFPITDTPCGRGVSVRGLDPRVARGRCAEERRLTIGSNYSVINGIIVIIIVML